MSLTQTDQANGRQAKLHDRLALAYHWTPVGAGRVLDLGGELTDIGRLPQWLARKCRGVCVVNIAEEAMRALRGAIGGRLSVVVADSGALPFAAQAFDLVIMTDVLEHVADEKKTIEEIHRVLVNNGGLVLSVPHRGPFDFLDPMNIKVDWYPIYKGLINLVKAIRHDKLGVASQNTFARHRHYSVGQLNALLGKRFLIHRVYRGGSLIYALSDLIRNVLEKVGIASSLRKTLRRLMDVDYRIQYGWLSYNLMIYATKHHFPVESS